MYRSMISLCVCALLMAFGPRKSQQAVPECTGGYEKVKDSTMCLVDSSNYVVGSAGVSEADKQVILDRHNFHRANADPEATNMLKVYWDNELAKIAEKWAKQCYVGHEHHLNKSRFIPAYGTAPGQNGAFGYTSWTSAIDTAWHGEVTMYKYGEDPAVYFNDPDGWKKIGHYTQVMTGQAMLIGCGYAECAKGTYKEFYICNYLVGNWNIQNPYKSGTTCADCPSSCKNGLCDCGDNFCFHGGKLDINTCTCTCKFPWTGQKCLQNPCPGVVCKNDGTLVVKGCTCKCKPSFTGQTCENCLARLDPWYCGTDWPKSDCPEYANQPYDCPILCETCPDPCSGVTCTGGKKKQIVDGQCVCG